MYIHVHVYHLIYRKYIPLFGSIGTHYVQRGVSRATGSQICPQNWLVIRYMLQSLCVCVTFYSLFYRLD